MNEATLNTLKADLSGQVAIVTGAAQGLGQRIAITLAANGAKVACLDMKKEGLEETIQAITDAGGIAKAHECNVTDRERVDQVVDHVVEDWEKIDILVNNAGITRDTLLPRMTDDEFESVINVNLRGSFLFMRAVSRYMMRARYGRIINMASISGARMGNPGQTNYSASKAALVGMTRSLSKEIAGRGVTVNAVAPGFIQSAMTDALGDVAKEEAKKRIPAKRLGTAYEVAAAVLFLASPAAGYITGHTLVVDGGITG
ncbi:MAG: 3-oxoacyl-[acyl-carrier-protein] reductase [Pirellulales bacterium]|nr:3-oxoacyl-[acyl-carrier-protein] reductase [Pirellulales bacterium]